MHNKLPFVGRHLVFNGIIAIQFFEYRIVDFDVFSRPRKDIVKGGALVFIYLHCKIDFLNT